MIKSKIYIWFSIAPFMFCYIFAMLEASGLGDLFSFHHVYFYVYICLTSMSWFSLFLAKKITKSFPFFVALFLFEGIGLLFWAVLLNGSALLQIYQEKIILIHISSIFIFYIVEYYFMSLTAQDKNQKQNNYESIFKDRLTTEQLEDLNESLKKLYRTRAILFKCYIVLANPILFFCAISSLVG